jgi:hypothetical protein
LKIHQHHVERGEAKENPIAKPPAPVNSSTERMAYSCDSLGGVNKAKKLSASFLLRPRKVMKAVMTSATLPGASVSCL